MRKLWRLLPLVLLAAIAAALIIVPGQVERRANTLTRKPPYECSARARELRQKLDIVDLHADSLLWSRDLNTRATRGHVDIPRLIEGHVALQAFTVVTKTPRHLNFQSNTPDSDNILLLSLVELWPPRTWTSLNQRALYQASRLRDFAARSQGRLTLIQTRADLESYLGRRAAGPAITAGFLGIEGAQALDGKLANIDVLYDAGFRMMSPSHFYDTEFGGSSAGVQKTGLTPLGREMIRRMEAKRMLVDLAHAAPRTIDDVLAAATRPVLVSHTGVKGTCDTIRNLGDEHLRGIARTGGIIGIAYFDFAVCGQQASAIARAIRHTADVAGIDHVALGSDFDGAIEAPFDTTGLGLLIDALLAAGFHDDEIARIMGGNAIRFLLANL